MGENGEEKLLVVARHIAKTLGRDDSMTDDILQIFSKFDGRFSRDSDHPDSDPPPLSPTLHSLDRQISQYLNSDSPIWPDSGDSAAFLDAIDELLVTLRDWGPVAATDKVVFASLSRDDELIPSRRPADSLEELSQQPRQSKRATSAATRAPNHSKQTPSARN